MSLLLHEPVGEMGGPRTVQGEEQERCSSLNSFSFWLRVHEIPTPTTERKFFDLKGVWNSFISSTEDRRGRSSSAGGIG